VTIGDVDLPRRGELPDSISGLILRNGAEVRPDPDFHRDMDRLVGRLEELLGKSAPVKRHLDKELDRLKRENELLRLDHQWLVNREKYMVGSGGEGFYPTWGAISRLSAVIVFGGSLFTAFAALLDWAAAVCVFSIFFSILCVLSIVLIPKTLSFGRARSCYRRQRALLVAEIEQLSNVN
jgi:hypothetical protein